MCGIGNNDNNGSNEGKSTTAFSAETMAKFSPDTAAKFQGQGFNQAIGEDSANINAQAEAAYDAGTHIAAAQDRANLARQQAYAASGGFLHGGPGSPMDPNWGNYTVGQQLSHMSTALAGTISDFAQGAYGAYSNTIGSPMAMITSALIGPNPNMPHWSDHMFEPGGLFPGVRKDKEDKDRTRPNETFYSGENQPVPNAINTAPITHVDVEDIEPRFIGGLIEKGKAYLTGEQGPELIITGENGQGEIIPNEATIQNGQVVPIQTSVVPMQRPKPSDRFLGDFSFIQDLEGTKSQGYVPVDNDGLVLGHSGVTVASGFDLGQRRNADLNGLPEDIIKKLQPFLGVKGQDALNLNYKDLNLTDEEVSIVNKFAKNEALLDLNTAFRKETGESFYNLPKAAQTVIASVAFQHGDLSTAAPNFWKQITNGDWNGAIANLEDWEGTGKDSTYQTRREKEADLLRKMRPDSEKEASLNDVALKYGFA